MSTVPNLLFCSGIEGNVHDIETSKKIVFVNICQVIELKIRHTLQNSWPMRYNLDYLLKSW